MDVLFSVVSLCWQLYLKSSEVNIRGLSFLIVANIAKWDGTMFDLNLAFSTRDVKLFLATYMAYKSEGVAMGDYLAMTNFPELCTQEFRDYVTRDEVLQVNNEDNDNKVMMMMMMMMMMTTTTMTMMRMLLRSVWH